MNRRSACALLAAWCWPTAPLGTLQPLDCLIRAAATSLESTLVSATLSLAFCLERKFDLRQTPVLVRLCI